ncbi:DIL domain-containing protein [Pterulicium gracile]|uniref:DIL domain-containing protein n=1 Tax=Pterulicium gracile TaxID=1884261 RepID=A0A5C3R1M4_9AGAR|nr:DIL domain-containing protein [Pterula gracilis]
MDPSTVPDLHPIYPTIPHVDNLMSPHSGLAPDEKAEFAAHCLLRACTFGDLALLSHLLADRHAQTFVDLAYQDEEGVGLVTLTIHGFGGESERDVEREECVRMLVAQGALLGADKAGWTPLHHAVLTAPPTLVSHLMTHGCSPFDVTRRNLTPLDIVTGHSVMPGRDAVALLLEASMKNEGWTGGRLAEQRRQLEEKDSRRSSRKSASAGIGKQLNLDPRSLSMYSSDTESEGEEEEADDTIYTPKPDFSSMLVFSPPSLPEVFDSLITNFPLVLRDGQPANSLYLLARFACLTCDHTWLEDLVIGAADAIEDAFFNRADDAVCLVFWLYNTTIWLHLMKCDESINEACEMMGLFELIEEVINSIFVFLIRLAERKIDQLLDQTLLDHSPLASEFESVQFESEWSFLRPFTSAKKKTSTSPVGSPSTPSLRPSSPPPIASPPPPSTTKDRFSSIRESFARARSSSSATPAHLLFAEASPQPSPETLTSFLTALHSLLTLAHINPALITQLWSQVMYWTSCEIFNRILTRKKYLCRSRAIQVGMNLGALEEWVDQMNLPKGINVHFAPVHDLLNWLQCLSSMNEFSDLIETVQKMKHVNPLQMRRALKDYRYEVQESKMTDECSQYLTQLQKDWERHRVKMGVEALRKEMGEREREREESGDTSSVMHSESVQGDLSASSSFQESTAAQQGIDLLFDREQDGSAWEPVQPPQVLGELLDSRYMLPLAFPSDSRLLAALPVSDLLAQDDPLKTATPDFRSFSRASSRIRGAMSWKSRTKRVREISAGALKWVDGAASASRWERQLPPDDEDEQEDDARALESPDDYESGEGLQRPEIIDRSAPLTRKPSARTKTRASYGGE